MELASYKIDDILFELKNDNTDAEKCELIKCIVKVGTQAQVKQMIDACVRDDKVKNKALFVAAQEGKTELVRYLVSEGADVNVRGETDDDIDAASEWIIEGPSEPDKDVTPLMLAADNGFTECMEVLIAAGADVNAVDCQERTALRRSVTEGNLAVVNLLIAAGADVNVADNQGYTALFKAVERILPDCVSSLIQAGADVNYRNRHGTALLWGTRMHEHNLRFLTKEELPLQSILEIISSLLSAGADVNVVNTRGETALYCAAEAIPEAIPLLIDAGADVNISENQFGDTVLGMVATSLVHQNVKLVLKAGAHVNKINDDDHNALETLLQCHDVDEKIAMLLFAAGETVNNPPDTSPSLEQPLRVPEYLLQKEQSLKHLCREAIRKHLLGLSPVNLFCRVPQLGLPSLLTEYLLYNTTIEPEDDDLVKMNRA